MGGANKNQDSHRMATGLDASCDLVGQASKREEECPLINGHKASHGWGTLSSIGCIATAGLGLWLVKPLLPAHVLSKDGLAWRIAQLSHRAQSLVLEHPAQSLFGSHLLVILAVFAVLAWRYGRRPAYLVDFYSFRPPDHLQGTNADLVHGCELTGEFNEQSMDFIRRITEMSGLGDQTFLPEEVRQGAFRDVQFTFDGARQETELALFVSIEKLLAKTKILPKQIDAIIINCCNFTPIPSLASAVVNRFKLKSTVLSYNFSGMGCAAMVIATGMADELLQNHKNMRILIASTENVNKGIYKGNQRSMMITNLIFKYGGVAFLMSNHPADARAAKYRLQHVVRTHLAANDGAYRCVYQQSDEQGRVGTKIGKELMNVAARGIALNIRTLGPLVLPASEKLKYVYNMFQRKVLKQRLPEYKPDFSKAFEHFCIHTGGKAVIDSVEKDLRLKAGQGEPCRATFQRYGNTSSTSTWYNWSYVETRTGVQKGDRVWQLAFGSGFKVASAVWLALRPIHTQHDAWTETPSC